MISCHDPFALVISGHTMSYSSISWNRHIPTSPIQLWASPFWFHVQLQRPRSSSHQSARKCPRWKRAPPEWWPKTSSTVPASKASTAAGRCENQWSCKTPQVSRISRGVPKAAISSQSLQNTDWDTWKQCMIYKNIRNHQKLISSWLYDSCQFHIIPIMFRWSRGWTEPQRRARPL